MKMSGGGIDELANSAAESEVGSSDGVEVIGVATSDTTTTAGVATNEPSFFDP